MKQAWFAACCVGLLLMCTTSLRAEIIRDSIDKIQVSGSSGNDGQISFVNSNAWVRVVTSDKKELDSILTFFEKTKAAGEVIEVEAVNNLLRSAKSKKFGSVSLGGVKEKAQEFVGTFNGCSFSMGKTECGVTIGERNYYINSERSPGVIEKIDQAKWIGKKVSVTGSVANDGTSYINAISISLLSAADKSGRNLTVSGTPKVEETDEGIFISMVASGKEYTVWSDDLSYSYKLPAEPTKQYIGALLSASKDNRHVTVQAEFSSTNNKTFGINLGKPFKVAARDKSGKDVEIVVSPFSTPETQKSDLAPASNTQSRVEQSASQPVLALQVIKAFIENEVGADKTYKGKRIAVQGVVKEVSRSLLGGYVIVIRPSMLEQGLNVAFGGNQNALTTDIYFYFMNASDKMTGLRGGDDVTFEGVCQGKSLKALGNVAFDECVIIKSPTR